MAITADQKVESIKNLIDGLPKKQIKDLKNWFDYTYKFDVDSKNTDFSIFYKMMSDHLEKIGIYSPPVSIFLKKSKIGTSTFVRLSKYIETTCGNINQTQRTSLYALFLDCLISYMDKKSIPISATTIVSSLGYVPGLIRISYPGYAEAGLLVKISTMTKQQ